MSFNSYSHYYDLLYQDKDYHSEAAYIDSLLKKYAISQSNILEFGSGTGIHAGYLCELGYLVHGVELSSEMVSAQAFSWFCSSARRYSCSTWSWLELSCPISCSVLSSLVYL